MAARFQIAEFHSDPFDPVPRAGGERLEEEGSGGGSLERRPSGVRGRRVEASETVAFPDGVSVTRRVTLPEEELLEDVLSFRGRTRSEPPNFWLAVQYGRELRRMSDEFVSSFSEDKGLRISKSAGAIVSTMYQKLVWYLPKKGQTEPQQTDSP